MIPSSLCFSTGGHSIYPPYFRRNNGLSNPLIERAFESLVGRP